MPSCLWGSHILTNQPPSTNLSIYYCYPLAKTSKLSPYCDLAIDFDFVNAPFFLRVIQPFLLMVEGSCFSFRNFAPFFPARLKNSAVYIFVMQTLYHATPHQQSTPSKAKRSRRMVSDGKGIFGSEWNEAEQPSDKQLQLCAFVGLH